MEYDSTTGQYYDHARYYGPGTGKFLSEDPLGLTARDANLYRYVGNSFPDSTDTAGEQDASSPTGPVNWPKTGDGWELLELGEEQSRPKPPS